jgi:hypothetical protein
MLSRITAVTHGIVLAAILLLFAVPALAAPAGTVVGLLGISFIESGGSRAPAALGQPVQVGDSVSVPADGRLKLRMADGSIVSLAAGSQLKISAYGIDNSGMRQEAQLSMTQGLLRAVVAPVDHPAKFEVQTAVGTAAVRSTDWFLNANATEMRVGVLRGSVVMTSSATAHGVLIPARYGARLEQGLDPVQARPWSPAEFAEFISRTDVR